MPQRAIATQDAGFWPASKGIAGKLTRAGRATHCPQQTSAGPRSLSPREKIRLSQILHLLRNPTSGIDLAQYQQTTIQRDGCKRRMVWLGWRTTTILAYILKEKNELVVYLNDFSSKQPAV